MTAVQTFTQQNLQSVLSFDGKDDYIDLGKKPELKIQKNLTLSAWINASKNDKEWIGIISKVFDTNSTESGYGILLDGKSGVYFALKVPSKGIQYLSSGANTLILNQWHHVACTYDGQTMKIYIDGIEKVSQNLPDSSIDYNPDHNLYIGTYKDNNEFYPYQGKMAEVRIWNKARSEAEIQQDMDHRLTGKEEGLMAYYPLSGDALDKSLYSNNGTIHGATWTQENLGFIEEQKANIEIAEIVYHGHVKRTQSDEYIEIHNSGNATADLSNWKVTSIGKNQLFAFPEGTSLAAGQMIRVYTNEVRQESGGFSFGSKTAIWNDKGDMAKLLDAEGKEVSSFSYGDQVKSENSIDSVKAELGISDLKVNISESDIKQLMTPQVKVSFLEAFRSVMKSFMEDGNLSESPLYILQELPDEYDLSDNPNDQEMNSKIKELLNDCGIELMTDAEDPADEWAGKVMCDETGEMYGTNSYWIFKLSPSQFTDINYAVVDKAGVEPTINWGFS